MLPKYMAMFGLNLLELKLELKPEFDELELKPELDGLAANF